MKRILGKGGVKVARIAAQFHAKLRLRGRASGFYEGRGGEADTPLQLHLSCRTYEDYQGAVQEVAELIEDLYRHYGRYARSKGKELPNLQLHMQELRRDDLSLNLFSDEVARSSRPAPAAAARGAAALAPAGWPGCAGLEGPERGPPRPASPPEASAVPRPSLGGLGALGGCAEGAARDDSAEVQRQAQRGARR